MLLLRRPPCRLMAARSFGDRADGCVRMSRVGQDLTYRSDAIWRRPGELKGPPQYGLAHRGPRSTVAEEVVAANFHPWRQQNAGIYPVLLANDADGLCNAKGVGDGTPCHHGDGHIAHR